MVRSRDSKYLRFSEPFSIGVVIDKHGNIKPPHTQYDLELQERFRKAMDESIKTGDRTELQEVIRLRDERARELEHAKKLQQETPSKF